jgi:predicted phage baseplate assembly protein
VLELDRPLERTYVPASVRVNANVAPATHGESWTETLGGGDARRAWTRLALSNAPLTYVRAPTPSGGRSTLTVRVGGVEWLQVDTLHGRTPGELVYTVRHGDDGSATVEFGPSSRPPSGTANITAAYQVGLGQAGNVAAGAISVPLSRPLGLRALSNPVAATGGADPEPADDARRNAPLPIKAMGRVVSQEDFRSFAAAFAGIAKARADAVWNGERRAVHLTVATESGAPVTPGDRTIGDLIAAIDAARHAETPVIVAGYDEVRFGLRAALEVDPRHDAETVLTAARDALLAAFSFGSRELAAPVRAGDVVAALHAVAGVQGAILAELHPALTTVDAVASRVRDILALPARWSAGRLAPAQLAVIDPDAVHLTERQA